MFFFTPSLFLRPKFQTKKMISNHYERIVRWKKICFFVDWEEISCLICFTSRLHRCNSMEFGAQLLTHSHITSVPELTYSKTLLFVIGIRYVTGRI